MMHPHDRGDMDSSQRVLKYFVDGTFGRALIGRAYQGRVQIHNNIGPCTAVQTAGDTLPSGAAISVDQTTNEVVVSWPAYFASIAPLANASFEDGAVDGWDSQIAGGTGGSWTATQDFKDDGLWSSKFAGAAGNGSEGGLELFAFNTVHGPVNVGQHVSGALNFMYNPSGQNFGCRGQTRLRWYGPTGQIGTDVLGDLIKTRHNNGHWTTSNVSGDAPAGATYCRLGGWMSSKGAPTWMDNASWTIPTSAGTNVGGDFNITLQVTDQEGQIATYTGVIHCSTWQYSFTRGTIPAGTTNFGRLSWMYSDDVNGRLWVHEETLGLWTSTDGLTWTNKGLISGIGNSNAVNCCTFSTPTHPKILVVHVADGAGRVSYDEGVTWANVIYPSGSTVMGRFTMTSDLCMFTVGNGTAMYSLDGLTWVNVPFVSGFLPGDSSYGSSCFGTYVKQWDMWVMPGQGNMYTFTGQIPTNSAKLYSTNLLNRRMGVVYSPLLDMVLCFGDVEVVTSNDRGVTWVRTNVPGGGAGGRTGAGWVPINGEFVSFGNNGTAGGSSYKSADGINWTNIVYTPAVSPAVTSGRVRWSDYLQKFCVSPNTAASQLYPWTSDTL